MHGKRSKKLSRAKKIAEKKRLQAEKRQSSKSAGKRSVVIAKLETTLVANSRLTRIDILTSGNGVEAGQSANSNPRSRGYSQRDVRQQSEPQQRQQQQQEQQMPPDGFWLAGQPALPRRGQEPVDEVG